tara:strand:+ start:992 stop:2758 length:1767 start_codon:yes stop_codon:yes gene_type:complete
MPDSSQSLPAAFNCEGGLVKNRSAFLMQPGEALVLENFEPDVEGGYRRINGHRKLINQIIPQTTSSGEKTLMVAKFADKYIAARGEKIFTSASAELSTVIEANTSMTGSGTIGVDSVAGFSSSGTLEIAITETTVERFTYTGVNASSEPPTFTGVTRQVDSTNAAKHLSKKQVSENWTQRDTGRTNASKYRFERFNFNGTEKIILVDEVNAPVVIDSAMNLVDITTAAVVGSKFVTSFRNHIFYAGKSTTPEELIFSVPFDEDDFTSGSGAGSIRVDDTITGIKVFRDALFIFCENRIFKLTGSSSSDFAIQSVTRSIGCINGDTIQEFGGDLLFLGPDGLRTIAATARIGDTELGTISRNVQSIFDTNIKNSSLFESVVIADKTQYRIFFSKAGQSNAQSRGIICVLKEEGFEFSEIRGIKPSCTDTFVETGNTFVLHGDFEGFIQRQEIGNTFDGTSILARYRSPDMSFGDTGIRKHMQRVIINYKPESSIDADLLVRYDNESADSSRPNAYPLDTTDVAALFGISSFSTAQTLVQFIFGGPSQPLVRQAVEGSGFSIVLRVNDGGETAPYSLKGFQLEYQLGARR